MALGYDWFGFSLGHGDVCHISPDNPGIGCLPTFPKVSGPDVTLGGAFALARMLEVRAGLGAGAYSIDGTRTGALLAQAEAIVFPISHIGIVASARTVAIPRYRQDRIGLSHWLLGVRLRP